MTEMTRQPNKRHRRRRYIRRLSAIIAVVVLLILAVMLIRRRASTSVISEQITYRKSLHGKGAFFFYEFAPDFLQGETLNISEKFLNRRLRAETGILPLKENALKRYQTLLDEKKKAAEAAEPELSANTEMERELRYLKQVIDAKQILVPKAGLVSLKLDGYESLYRPQSLNALLPGDISFDQTDMVIMPGLKIVDNRKFFLAVDLPQTLHARSLSLGQYCDVQIDDKTSLNGRIERIVSDELNRTLIILSMDAGFDRVRDRRYIDAEIRLEERSAFKLPIDAVVNISGRYYCYILDASGIAHKRRVELLDTIESERVFIVAAHLPKDEKGESERTVERLDRVVLDPGSVKEGAMY